MSEILHPDIKLILEKITEVLFPLKEWVQNKEYIPDERLPDGISLSPKDLGIIQFMEGLIRESSGDAVLVERWHEIHRNPFKYNPLSNPSAWRSSRGLTETPIFAVGKSENILTDDLGILGNPISRVDFYTSVWSLLKRAFDRFSPNSNEKLQEFVHLLFEDKCPGWAPTEKIKSSAFIIQLTRDMLYAMMGMRNFSIDPAHPEWKFHLLIELGAHRRVGNKYERADLELASDKFNNSLIDSIILAKISTP